MEKEQENNRDKENIFKIGITHGDLNGIGYEVIIKALNDQRLLELFTPVVYGHSKVASYHRKSLSIGDFNFNTVRNASSSISQKVNLVNCFEGDVKIELGTVTSIAGKLAYKALEFAVEDLKRNNIDAVVTAPINKENIQSDSFHFPGHTEYFASKFGVEDYLMLMVSDKLRIGVLTGHMPLKEVPVIISEELLEKKIIILNDSLIKDFNIRKPKIAVLGLNPHAGENGLLGAEEENIIIPVIKKMFDSGIYVYGPYPADGIFGSDAYKQFDGIMAMYHDQGMVPFKTLAFDEGVNFTAGLPVVRTSPAHGTAYDLAGKNQASSGSMRSAIYLALDVLKNRHLYFEINKNPLPFSGDGDEHAENDNSN
ncbi:4-hydroxythreonine-4-phosphate dehydrogenase PdxA [Bacteroidota bacterium]